jgi:ribosomal protein S2
MFLDLFFNQKLKRNKKLKVLMFCDEYPRILTERLKTELDRCDIKLISGIPETGYLSRGKNRYIDLIISANSLKDFDIYREADVCGIPVVGLCSTSINSQLLAYPIVSNMYNYESVLLFVILFKQFLAGLELKNK